MGIVYRSERKRILRSQLHLVQVIKSLLDKCAAIKTKMQFNELVLEKTESERD
jgi:hypothetical protein